MNKISKPNFQALLPDSISEDATIKAASAALEPILQTSANAIPNLLLWSRLWQTAKQAQPFPLLPALDRMISAKGGLKNLSTTQLELLAWQLHVDFREIATSDEQLAHMITKAIHWHRIKGTPASLINALNLFGYGINSAQDVLSPAGGEKRLSHQSQTTASAAQEPTQQAVLKELFALGEVFEPYANREQSVRSSGITIEEFNTARHWADYQLGLPEAISEKDVDKILSICREMQPARCRLWRIYTNAYDCRPIVLSHGPALGSGWLSYYSGVPAKGHEDVLISFGLIHKILSEAYAKDLAGSAGIILHLGLIAPYLDRFIVSRSALSDVYPRNHGLTISSHFSILWAERATLGRKWQGLWDERRWQDYTGFDRKLPPWRMERRKNYFSQAVPSWDAKISNINTRLGGTFATIINNPAKLSDFKLSSHDAKRQELRLEQMFIYNNMFQSQQLKPKNPYLAKNNWLYLSPKVEARHGQNNFNLDLSLKLTDLKWQNFENNIHLKQVLSTNLQLNLKPATAITSLERQSWTKKWDERCWNTENIILVE